MGFLMGKTSLLSATLFQSKLALYTSYVLGATLPKGLLPEALFWAPLVLGAALVITLMNLEAMLIAYRWMR